MKKRSKRSNAKRSVAKKAQIDLPIVGGVLIGDSLRARPTPAKPLGISFTNHAPAWTTKQHGKKFVKGFVKK